MDPIKSDQGSNTNNNGKEYDISDNDIPWITNQEYKTDSPDKSDQKGLYTPSK